MEARRLKTIGSGWSNAILICKKCSKKVGGGFGPKGKMSLAKALRKDLKLKKGRKAALGIVELKCLGVCPYGAITVVNAANSGNWRLVRPGTDLERVKEALGIDVPD